MNIAKNACRVYVPYLILVL